MKLSFYILKVIVSVLKKQITRTKILSGRLNEAMMSFRGVNMGHPAVTPDAPLLMFGACLETGLA